MDKIAAPEGLTKALTRALNYESIDAAASQSDWELAERLLETPPFQEWLTKQEARFTGENASQGPTEPREPVKVVCTVKVPLGTPPEAVHALSAVPIHARLAYEAHGGGLIAGIFGVGALVATWDEER